MERLKELRDKKSLLQKDVAREIGVDRTTYAKYESGASEPSFEILKRIARFFDVSTDYLLDFCPENPGMSLSEEEMKLIHFFRALIPHDKYSIITQVEALANSSKLQKEESFIETA